MAVFLLQMLISSDELNVSDVKVIWYKNGAHKTTADGETYKHTLNLLTRDC